MVEKAVPTDPVTYSRIKSQVKREAKSRWPSAYLSGIVVQKYKAAMKKKGVASYKASSPRKSTPLKRWYAEKWIDIKTGKPCGSVRTKTYYPTCRPSVRKAGSPVTVKELSERQKKKMIRQKQKAKKKTVHYKY
ncbi:hypothetical protein PBCVNY2B_799L [Paramecium bursaria Chlorella virus NY2B]|uniref:Uncharacterized protein B772L n=1 Tax=Paramecium bursaria Chlorella virus NY2A TaxID=46021 RepID=A7IXU7_PBCVN|nr:hypothetical protein NY2A_B772L [Paramecium bursaria Chlorella virus NY2A]YP_001498780.1 hypothetical protein AR158_C699L [Paramecium bursaria Chlorella virus AR158]ABT15171.1 hypothetical protein NY2A_B772L [Paramecium bursaria Chlorella virus NY2A]ABU44244.1 hypothetical protein AR158_C699L [Paramecium bursaria Chlorella virus AR158]AGE58511.1 hypothetical protein PBCVNY2B_799L [Paramecium bursaria Chlorella virus NY2B]